MICLMFMTNTFMMYMMVILPLCEDLYNSDAIMMMIVGISSMMVISMIMMSRVLAMMMVMIMQMYN